MAEDPKIVKAKREYKDAIKAEEKARTINRRFNKMVDKQVKIIAKIQKNHKDGSYKQDSKYISAVAQLQKIQIEKIAALEDFHKKVDRSRTTFQILKRLERNI